MQTAPEYVTGTAVYLLVDSILVLIALVIVVKLRCVEQVTITMCKLLPVFDDLRTELVVNCILNAPFSIVAILGNALVLLAIWRTPSLHTPSNILLFNLAVSDLGVGLLVQPFYIAYKSSQLQDVHFMFCFSGFAFNFLSPFLMAVTLLTLATVSVDRFLAIYLHLRYREVVTTKPLAVLLGLVWLLSAFYASTVFWAVKAHRILTVVMIASSLLVTFVSYFKILQVVRRHQKQMRKQSFALELCQQETGAAARMARYKKTVFSSMYVFSLLLLCYIPYFCARVASTRAEPRESLPVHLALNFTATFVYVNSSLNPLVYCWRIREIRGAVLKIAKTLFRRSGPRSVQGTFEMQRFTVCFPNANALDVEGNTTGNSRTARTMLMPSHLGDQ